MVVRFIQQAAEAAACQVFLIVVVAAATESARNIPAEEINNTFFLINSKVTFFELDTVFSVTPGLLLTQVEVITLITLMALRCLTKSRQSMP